jgi:hypothetical protein
MISLEAPVASPPPNVMPLPKRVFNVEYRETRDTVATTKLKRLTFEAVHSVGVLCDNISRRCGWEKESFELAARKGSDGPEYFLDDEDAVGDVVMSDESRSSHTTFKRRTPTSF